MKRPQPARPDDQLDLQASGLCTLCTPVDAHLTHVRTLVGVSLPLQPAHLAKWFPETPFMARPLRTGYAIQGFLRRGDLPRIMGVTRPVSVLALRTY